jgi:hypothetical protein
VTAETPDQASRRRAGIKDYTCGLCGGEFGSNCRPGSIECAYCDARLCPCCGSWFGELGDMSQEPPPVPELAAYEADIASLADQRNRVSETADQLRAQVRNLRDALERCRDAAGRSPAAVHTIASQALASSPLPGGDL